MANSATRIVAVAASVAPSVSNDEILIQVRTADGDTEIALKTERISALFDQLIAETCGAIERDADAENGTAGFVFAPATYTVHNPAPGQVAASIGLATGGRIIFHFAAKDAEALGHYLVNHATGNFPPSGGQPLN